MTRYSNPLVAAMLQEEDDVKRCKIIEELGAQSVIDAVEPLMEQVLLNEYHSGTAIVALGNIGDARAVGALIESFKHQNLAWIAKDALNQIGAPAFASVVAALGHDDPDVRFMSMRWLVEMNDPRAIEPLQELIEHDPNDINRGFARNCLKTLALENLQADNADDRLMAVHGLARLGDARTIEPLQLVADREPDDEVRQLAERTIEHLLRGVETDPFATHELPSRSRATNILINELHSVADIWIPEPERENELESNARALKQLQEVADAPPDEEVRQLALDAFRLLSIDLLRHPDREARLAGARALGWLGDAGAIKLLRQVAEHDPNAEVQREARSLIE